MTNKSLGKTNSYSKKTLEGLVYEAELFIGGISFAIANLLPTHLIFHLGKEIVVQTPLDASAFLSGRVFLGTTTTNGHHLLDSRQSLRLPDRSFV